MHLLQKRWELNGDTAQRNARQCAAFTLAEVVVSLLIIGISIGGILSVYVQSAVRSDWSAMSLSAQMMAMRGMEQCRAAKYDPRGSPPVDQLVSFNFPSQVDILDIGAATNVLSYGTNVITFTTVSTNPLIKMIQVDCRWAYPRRGLFTNTVVTYRAPNQ